MKNGASDIDAPVLLSRADYEKTQKRIAELELANAQLEKARLLYQQEEDALRAEVAALRKDAERYRHMKTHGRPYGACRTAAELDAALDAAIAKRATT